VPTEFAEAHGIRYAYRRFGAGSGTPLLFRSTSGGPWITETRWSPTAKATAEIESHATTLDRNEVGALLVAAGLGAAAEHALISLLALNGLRVSEATGTDIEHMGLERGHRTVVITRKGGKAVTIPLAPRTERWRSRAGAQPESGGACWLRTRDGRCQQGEHGGEEVPQHAQRLFRGHVSLGVLGQALDLDVVLIRVLPYPLAKGLA
jgi:hypothetical protein